MKFRERYGYYIDKGYSGMDFNDVLHRMFNSHSETNTVESVHRRLDSITEFMRVYADITMTDEQKIKMADRFEYDIVEDRVMHD